MILESNYDQHIEGSFKQTKFDYAYNIEKNNAWGGELEANLLALNYNIWISILRKTNSNDESNWYVYKNTEENARSKRPDGYLFLLNEFDDNDEDELSGHYTFLKNPYIPRIDLKFKEEEE